MAAGFVLVGGESSRMGRDKALLPLRGSTLVEWVARSVRAAAGTVTLVGPPERYSFPGLKIIPDLRRGCGPLAGIEAALASSGAEWNLVAACDMPALDAFFLARLLDHALRSGCDAVAPAGAGGRPEPLCAVYHRRALATISSALDCGVRRAGDALRRLRLDILPSADASALVNCNTPEEWVTHVNSLTGHTDE